MRNLCAALLGLLLASAAQAQQVVNPNPNAGIYGAYNSGAQTCVTGTGCWLQTDINGQLKITGTVTTTPSGTQNVNLTQILSAAPSLTNPLWVFPATGATFPISGTVTANQGTAGSAWPVTLTSTTVTGTVAVTQSTSPWVVSNSGTFPVQATLSAETTKVIGTVNQGTSPWVVSGTVATTEPVGITPTDRTITSATGASQTMMAANASRHSLTIVNNGSANCGVNPTGGTAAINGAGTITIVPTGSYTPRVPTLSAVTVICTSTQPIYGDEN